MQKILVQNHQCDITKYKIIDEKFASANCPYKVPMQELQCKFTIAKTTRELPKQPYKCQIANVKLLTNVKLPIQKLPMLICQRKIPVQI